MMGRNIARLILAFALLNVAFVQTLFAVPGGFTGRTLLTSSSGCGSCHGSSPNTGVQATINGPSVVAAGQSANFMIRVTVGTSTSTKAGVNIAVSAGSLSAVSSQLQLSGSEITQNTRLTRNTDYTFRYTAPASGGPVTIYATVAGDANTWNWASNVVVTLPVQLVSLAGAIVNSNTVRLNWRTVSEVNNYGFFVQRSTTDEMEFVDLPNGFVAGHGTTNIPQTYVCYDNAATARAMYYRLRQVDLDGTEHLTEPILVERTTSVGDASNTPATFALEQNFPNPFNPMTTIRFSVAQTNHATLTLYNSVGEQVAIFFDELAEAGHCYSLRLDAKDFASGIYFYRLQTPGFIETRKMIVTK